MAPRQRAQTQSVVLAETKFYKLTNFSVDSTETNTFPVAIVISPVVTRVRLFIA